MSNDTNKIPAPVSHVLATGGVENVEVRNTIIANLIMVRTWHDEKVLADLRLSPTEARKLAKVLNMAALHCEHVARANA